MNYDQLYADFTNKVLPEIAQGLTVTKEYFTDLFGRYVQYLTVTDTLLVVLFVLLFITGFFATRKGLKMDKENEYGPGFIIAMFGAGACVFGFLFACFSISNLAKDIYIPEVRVYQTLNGSDN